MESKNSSFEQKMVNPMIKSALKNQEASETCVSYNSILKKSGMFLLVVILGAIAAMLIHFLVPSSLIPISGADQYVDMSTVEMVILIICLVLSIVMPIVASFVAKASAVCGSLACFSYGYILGFMAVAIKGYQGPILLALALTIAVVSALILLYQFKIIRVSNKLMTIVGVLFLTMFIASILLLICYFIPGLREIVISMWNTPWLSILFGVLGVVIGILFLLCDFKAIEDAVEHRVDKKYENRLAFGLAFSVIWLYFKILELILRIMQVARR